MVTLTQTLDKLIFEDLAQAINITIGGEGGYRIKVQNDQELQLVLSELESSPGKAPWGVSKSYKIKGLTVHTFIDMRYKIERYSTIF